MATRYRYSRDSEDHLIVVPSQISPNSQFFNLKMGLDTGASHTIVDLNFLLTLDFQLSEAKETVEIMTGNGKVTAYIFEVAHFNCLEINRINYRLMAYDFLTFGIIDTYEGLIGLDFFPKPNIAYRFSNRILYGYKTYHFSLTFSLHTNLVFFCKIYT